MYFSITIAMKTALLKLINARFFYWFFAKKNKKKPKKFLRINIKK